MIKDSLSRKIFVYCNACILTGLIIATLYPVWYVVCASFSNPDLLVMHQGFLLLPIEFTTSAYEKLLQNPMIITGFGNTLIVVVGGLALNMVMTVIGAYFFSRRDVMFKDILMLGIVFTMFFSGGLIPFYFTVKELHLDNSLLALIIPGAISTYNLIVLRTAFAAVPVNLEESAALDGAGHLCIIRNIYVPLTLPSIAVIVLYVTVSHWNSWFNAAIFLRKREMYPIQLVLREILIQNSTDDMLAGMAADESRNMGELIKYALIVVSVLPMVILYPFIQKFFVKGVMIGAVKG